MKKSIILGLTGLAALANTAAAEIDTNKIASSQTDTNNIEYADLTYTNDLGRLDLVYDENLGVVPSNYVDLATSSVDKNKASLADPKYTLDYQILEDGLGEKYMRLTQRKSGKGIYQAQIATDLTKSDWQNISEPKNNYFDNTDVVFQPDMPTTNGFYRIVKIGDL